MPGALSRTKRYKFIWNFELYDLAEDPAEIHNLADRPEYAELVSGFTATLKALQEATDDPWLHKWVYE